MELNSHTWEELAIHKWKQKGNAYLWRYKGNPKNFPGWHFTADPEGCISLISFFKLLLDAPAGTNRTIQFKSKCIDSASSRKKQIWEKKLNLIKSEINSSWHLNVNLEESFLEIGNTNIQEFIAGIEDILSDRDDCCDYCIGERGQELWFWWYVTS